MMILLVVTKATREREKKINIINKNKERIENRANERDREIWDRKKKDYKRVSI